MRKVSRWQAGIVASIALAAGGFLLGTATLLVAGLIPLTYAMYAAVASVPAPDTSLRAERDLSPGSPLPGEPVHVTTTIHNEGDQTLPDVRIVDGVPGELDVVSGSDRCLATLRPGESVDIEYELQPRRGSYAFEDPRVRLRSVSAAAVSTAPVPVSETASFECGVPLEGLPIHRRTTPFVGSVPTQSGGEGHEFHSTREYRHGDPLSRVNWRQYAKTGDLGTILFREQEAARVVVVVDGRRASVAAPSPGMPDGVTLSSYAGAVTASALSDAGHQVGVAGLGVTSDLPGVYNGPPAFVEPGTGSETLGRIARVCDAVAATGSTTSPEAVADGGRTTSSRGSKGIVTQIDALTGGDTQVVVCTPVVDPGAVEVISGLRRRGTPTTVIAPDVTTGDTVGSRVASLERKARLTKLRQLDVPVIDWDPEIPLQRALADGLGEVIR